MLNSLLNGYKWSEITREERFFCAHLYHLMIKNQAQTMLWIKNNLYPEINLEKTWEIGYEVCFYRDYYFWFKEESSRAANLSPKRTFDLALFSDDELIIIEAKVHEIFKKAQVAAVFEDKQRIKTLFNKKVNVLCYALAPSKYFENSNTFKQKWLNKDFFDDKITWKQMATLFGDDALLYRAEWLRYVKCIDELLMRIKS